MSEPVRIQRQRRRGWRMRPNTVYVGRPSKWANPFRVTADFTAAQAVCFFERWIAGGSAMEFEYGEPPSLDAIREALAGKNLACWCAPGGYCHADVLLRIANVETEP